MNIRSFVRREGRMTKGQKKAFKELWPKYCLELSQGKIDFAKVFGRDTPLILEIGFGMGQSLLTMAEVHPEQDFIGIEVFRPGVGHLFAELAKQKLTNVRIYCADAIEVLQQCIVDHSLNEILIFFPDPWPKKRHHKRRLIQPEFIALSAKKLKSKGLLHIATDWEDYANHIFNVILQSNLFHQIKTKPRPVTKFEQRGQRLGHKIWDICFALDKKQ
jgi:tRNA (guanine-N7-)-methyltransferase